MRGVRLAARVRVVSSGGRGRTSVERRRVFVAADSFCFVVWGSLADASALVGSGAAGLLNRASCLSSMASWTYVRG